MTFPSRLFRRVGLGVAAGLTLAAPVLAQTVNFETLTLGSGSPSASVRGYTGGFFPLTNIASRDYRSGICTGFAAEVPDHLLVLQRDYESLTLQVNSGGQDTTLLVQGPSDNIIRCGQDTSRRNPDGQIQDSWPAGTYRVWVGTHVSGQQYNYTLTASETP